MARRGRKRKFRLKINIQPETLRSVAALVLILLGLVSLISFFAPSYPLNKQFQTVLLGLFGYPSILVPVILVISGLIFMQAFKLKIQEPRLVIGIGMLLLSLSSLFHLISEKGGYVGDKVASVLAGAVSVVGAYSVVIILLFISILLIFDKSLSFLTDLIRTKFGEIEAFKNISFGRLRGETGGEDGEEAEEITSFVQQQQSQETEEVYEETFEVIPSMSEPQGASQLPLLDGALGQVKPNLPYADRVWTPPPLDLLLDPPNIAPDAGDTAKRAKTIEETLRSFGIDVKVVDIKPGPSVTQYVLDYEMGKTKISKITGLQNDLALALASTTGTVRIEAPIPGTSYIGVEVPNNNRVIVNFKSQLTSEPMKKMKSKLSIVLGKDVSGRTHVHDVSTMPHMLVAGTTGSGKSVFIHNIIFSIMYRATPQEVKFILVDPKRVELGYYQDTPHLYTPVVTDMEKAPSVFRWAVIEMEKRYKLFEAARARNIDAYNEKSGFQALPYIVIIVDELAEIMVQDPTGVEKSIIRLAQLARATGIHLILSLQRPSTNVITGLIKANITCRVAFNVASGVDSRVIIDQPGAEKLLGNGDMLFIPPDNPKPVRLQGAFVSEKEIIHVVDHLKNTGIKPEYNADILETPTADATRGMMSSGQWGDVDELFEEAMEISVSAGKASASLLQRRLSIGYTRAARILDELEDRGIVGPQEGSKPRDVLIDNMPRTDFDDTSNLEDSPLTSLQ